MHHFLALITPLGEAAPSSPVEAPSQQDKKSADLEAGLPSCAAFRWRSPGPVVTAATRDFQSLDTQLSCLLRDSWSIGTTR